MDSPLDRRVPLCHLPTPVEPMERLAAWLGLPAGTLWVKRDDCTGLAGGGNKARKLEYLCAEALDRGCDVLVTGGGSQSNHARMTGAAANRLGLSCTLVLAGEEPEQPAGNVLLDQLLAAHIVWVGTQDYYGMEAAIDQACHRLRAEGHRPYPIPVGGASTVGALGYVQGGVELCDQLADVDLVVCADGSGGTHAGLAAALGDHSRVLGVDVGTRPDLDERVPEKAAEVADRVGRNEPVGTVRIDHQRYGEGYGATTAETRVAMDASARLEGLLLDPVYTGRAMAGLINVVRQGVVVGGSTIVFLHTGGLPALFARRYAEWIAAGSGSAPGI